MWIKQSKRAELVDIAANPRRRIAGAFDLASPSLVTLREIGGELTLGWADDPQEKPQFPSVVFVSEPNQREFLAWAATFLEFFRPFTAFARVLDPSALQVLFGPEPSQLPELAQPPLVGLILGEVLSETEGRGELRSIFPIACLSTYSFVMARALSVQSPMGELVAVTRRWDNLLRLTKQPRRRLSAGTLQDVWAVVLRGLSRKDVPVPPSQPARADEKLCDAVTELVESHEIRQSTWRSLTNGISEFQRLLDVMRGSREERVLGCERALHSLRHVGVLGGIPRDFIAGFLVSRVSPGTLDHVGILRGFASEMPAAMLWYGFCAGCHPSSDVLNAGNGLGRRISRDVIRPESIVSHPTGDIALEELEVLANEGAPPVPFRQERSGYLKVEILPNVCVHLRNADAEDDAPDEQDTAELARQLDDLVWRMYELRRRLLPGYPTSEDEPDRPTRRGRRKK